MKISVLKENLAKALSTCGRVVSTRGSLEILSNVMLTTEDGRLKVSATNLEVGINYWLGAKIEKEGAITVPARLLTDIINSLSSEKVELEVEELNLHLNSDKDKLTIKGISVDEFPLIPSIDNSSFKISSKVLRDALNLVNFAAALDEARPVLSGVYMNIDGDKLILAATDSYRLAEKIIKLEKKVTDKYEIIVPARALIELARTLGDFDEDIKVCINENQISFAAPEVEFTSRLIEGSFPNYKQIIPDNSDTKALVNVADFTSVLKVASLFARESANSVNIFVRSKGKIEINATSSQIGDSSSVVSAEVSGKDGEISFNSRYILDVLGNLKDDKIEFEISGKLNPGVIRPEASKDYTYIIMPLRS
jgi:DNA polymerase-3 subunit beta